MAAPAVYTPDIVKAVRAYLEAALPSVPVSSKIPNPRPTKFVTVQRKGGVMRTLVSDTPQLQIESWAGSDIDADALARDVRTLMFQMADGTNRDGVIVYRLNEFSGPVYREDPASKQDRFQWTIQLHTRTAAAAASS